jgi:hypothetical protein
MDSALRTDPQRKQILKLLKTRPYVTNVDLNRICYRYSARIHELKKEGWNIKREYWKPGVHKYSLAEPKEYGDVA